MKKGEEGWVVFKGKTRMTDDLTKETIFLHEYTLAQFTTYYLATDFDTWSYFNAYLSNGPIIILKFLTNILLGQ